MPTMGKRMGVLTRSHLIVAEAAKEKLKKKSKKDKRQAAFGWDVFNQVWCCFCVFPLVVDIDSFLSKPPGLTVQRVQKAPREAADIIRTRNSGGDVGKYA